MQHTLDEMSRFNFLINNILIASQLEAGSYTLNKQSIHFSELVQKSIHTFSLRHAQRNFISHVEENIFIKGEYTLLEMLINNLIDNAIKYSPKEKNITIQLYRQNDKAFLLVKDEGNGIAENEKKKVFDKFYRIGSEETRIAKGTGIGLYLCKKLWKTMVALFI